MHWVTILLFVSTHRYSVSFKVFNHMKFSEICNKFWIYVSSSLWMGCTRHYTNKVLYRLPWQELLSYSTSFWQNQLLVFSKSIPLTFITLTIDLYDKKSADMTFVLEKNYTLKCWILHVGDTALRYYESLSLNYIMCSDSFLKGLGHEIELKYIDKKGYFQSRNRNLYWFFNF